MFSTVQRHRRVEPGHTNHTVVGLIWVHVGQVKFKQMYTEAYRSVLACSREPRANAAATHFVFWVLTRSTDADSVALRSCSSCVGAITARAHRLRSRNRRVRSSAFLHMVPREHTCVSLCLSHDCGFFPRAFPQSRARRRRPVRLPPLHRPPFRASLPRDCPILRPRAGLPISRGPASLSVRASEPHAAHESPHPCGTLLAVACLRRDTSSTLRACSRLWSHISLLPNARKPLFFSLVRRMIATLINCAAEKSSAHSGNVTSVAFSPDGTKIVSGSDDGTIKVWNFGAPEPSNRPSLAKADACWLVWQARWSC